MTRLKSERGYANLYLTPYKRPQVA